MVLYIDETENEEFFIVAGLLVDSEASINLAYKRFKKRIQGFKLGKKVKSDLFTEFKATLLDKKYQRIKVRMLEEIRDLDGVILFSCHEKKGPKFNQILKESVYITLFSSIVSALAQETIVIFDSFGKADFENRIMRSVDANPIVTNIFPKESQSEPGLQFIDNICSVIRLHLSGEDSFNYFSFIEKMAKAV